jgi:DNA-directed RNA polymerase specialized sigma24 family protein
VTEREAPAPPASFEGFFEAEHARLLRALYLVTGNVQEAEELMQDAFLTVWERWDRVAAMDEPVGYLYRTAMNRFRSRLRRVKRAARKVVGSAEGGTPSRPPTSVTPSRGRSRRSRTPARRPGADRAPRLRPRRPGILGVKDVTVRSLASQARAALRIELEA